MSDLRITIEKLLELLEELGCDFDDLCFVDLHLHGLLDELDDEEDETLQAECVEDTRLPE